MWGSYRMGRLPGLELRQAYREGQEDQLGSLGLVLNIIVLWNTIYMDAAIQVLRGQQQQESGLDVLLGVSLDIENYCTLRLFFDLSTLAGLSRRNLPEAGIRLLFQI